MALASSRLIIILAVVLVVVVGASVAVLVLVPGEEGGLPQLVTTPTPTPDIPPGTAAGFDLRVFQRQAYQELNQQLIQDGRLPVVAPVGSGKANPFL